MKFRCDACGQKYSIADEKVSGRVLKIRCRKCKAVIRVSEVSPKKVVKGGGASAAVDPSRAAKSRQAVAVAQAKRSSKSEGLTKAGQTSAEGASAQEEYDQESTRAMPAPVLKEVLKESREQQRRAASLKPRGRAKPDEASAPESPSTHAEPPQVAIAEEQGEAWHTVVAGKQEGPFSLAELREGIVAGRISRRTYVWSAQLDDWRPIGTVTRLRPLFEELFPASPGAAPASNFKKQTMQLSMEDIRSAAHRSSQEGEDLSSALASAAEAAPVQSLGASEPLAGETPSAAIEDPFQAALNEAAIADPFAGFSDTSDPDAPPRETTQMFIVASGVNKRRSPLRIGAALLGFAGMIGAIGYLLTLTGVDIKGLIPVKKEHHAAQTTGGAAFDPEHAKQMRDQLLGAGKVAQPEASLEAIKVHGGTKRNVNDEVGPTRQKEVKVVEALTAKQRAGLAALYGESRRGALAIKVKPQASKDTAVDSAKSPIDPAVIQKKIGEVQRGFQNCVQSELRRNPGFKGKKILLSIIVLPSGIVRSASIDDRMLHASDVGVCVRRTTKRLIFPSFGETDSVEIQVPILLTTGY